MTEPRSNEQEQQLGEPETGTPGLIDDLEPEAAETKAIAGGDSTVQQPIQHKHLAGVKYD
jgi:hypothetical protein